MYLTSCIFVRRGAAAALLALVLAMPLRGQSGNQSDVGGVVVTGAGGAASIFAMPIAQPSVMAIGGVNGLSGVSVSVHALSVPIVNSLIAGSFVSHVHPDMVITGETGTEFVHLMSVALDSDRAEALTAHLEAAIRAVPGAPPRSRIRSFLGSMHGLMVNPTPVALDRATQSFNKMLDSSSAAFLAGPPQEFLAAHSLLFHLIEAVAK